MEFRIAPMILVVFNVCFITLANPFINEWIPLKDLANYSKILIPFGLLFLLALGTYLRHTYYTKVFKMSFITLMLLSLGMLAFYIVAIEQQNL
jgi:hypothetical protein